MFWYKHFTGSHDDPDISDAWDELGDFGYVGFFVILEIYGQEYSHRDSEDFINISMTFLRRKLRKSLGKVKLLLNFFHKRKRIITKVDGDRIQLKVPKFIELASNWTKRLPTEVTTEAPTAKKIERKIDKKIEKKKKINTLIEYSESFLKFYNIYPKKFNKKEAFDSWLALNPDDELVAKIVAAVPKQIESGMLNVSELKYCQNPARWLNNRRWEEDIIVIKKETKSGDAQHDYLVAQAKKVAQDGRPFPEGQDVTKGWDSDDE